MKANELMQGDFIYPDNVDNSIIARVVHIEDNKIGFVVPNCNTVWWNSPEKICPIPIVPEILEKNGFKIDKNETYCKRYFFASNLDKVPQTVVEFSFYGEGVSADTLFKCWTKPESCDGENSIHICDLKSVHELRHCLKLVGIDKEIIL